MNKLEDYILDFQNDLEEVTEFKFNKETEAFEVFCEEFDNNYGSIEIDDNLITIHTGGWSENEYLVSVFMETSFWYKNHIITSPGGHYYIDTDRLNSDKKHFKIIKNG